MRCAAVPTRHTLSSARTGSTCCHVLVLLALPTLFLTFAARKGRTPTMRMPTVFVNHGGGPMPLMGEPNQAKLAGFLSGMRHTLPKPDSIVIITAHWEERRPTVSSNPRPGMLYDYYGFPPEAYQIKYSAPGSPQLAARVLQLLKSEGIEGGEDAERGYDHGTFVPLKLMYPDADIPVVQLSLVAGLDPGAHVRLGRALAPLRDEGVLLVGSGLSFHNLPKLMGAMRGGPPVVDPASRSFDDWLVEAVTGCTGEERGAKLGGWSRAPGARQAHPREEHLLPLMVVAGAGAGDQGQANFRDTFMGVARVSGFVFGAAQQLQ